MHASHRQKVPVLLMVSGGSDSTALLQLAAKYAHGSATVSFRLDPCDSERTRLLEMLAAALPPADCCELSVLHVNHLLRGAASDDDEAFVVAQCANLAVPCTVRRVDVAALAAESPDGMEAVARRVRYRLAGELLDAACAQMGVEPRQGIVCTAHTLDDRVETFLMRALVGTGPGGLGSIPRVRGRIRRPLLDATREELREWLRARHPGAQDYELWREDATNEDGSNFRSRVRAELVPAMRRLRPQFERSLSTTMDLIAEEDAEISQIVDSTVYRSLSWDGRTARLPVEVLSGRPRFLARRILRACLLVVEPAARLEAAQIERVLAGLSRDGFVTEVSGGIRVRVTGGQLVASVEQ